MQENFRVKGKKLYFGFVDLEYQISSGALDRAFLFALFSSSL